MSFDILRSPVQFLQQAGISADQDWLREYEAWFEREGQEISDGGPRRHTVVTHVRSVGRAGG